MDGLDFDYNTTDMNHTLDDVLRQICHGITGTVGTKVSDHHTLYSLHQGTLKQGSLIEGEWSVQLTSLY
jgi:hypothetical protein